LWNETPENNSVDCDSLQLAVKVAFIGILFGVTWDITYLVLRIIYLGGSSPIDFTSFNFLITILSNIGFIGSIFVSVGFVAIFSMKRSKLGIMYPLMVLIPFLGQRLYLILAFTFGIYNGELHSSATIVIGYVITIIGGLLLLSIRRKSANSQFLTIFAVFYLVRIILTDAIWYIIFGGPVPVNTGFDILITSIPYQVTFFVMTALIVIFFVLESRQGCIEESGLQETPFLE